MSTIAPARIAPETGAITAQSEVSVSQPRNCLNAELGLKSWLLTQDHKRIATLYLMGVSFFFLVGGLLAMAIRIELLTPPTDLMAPDTYNKILTMHGIVMVFFVLIPGIPAVPGNFVLPMMLGARDLTFPKINLLAWYCYVVAAILLLYTVIVGVTLPAAGQQTRTAPNAEEQPTPLIHSVEGPDLFRAYCASCHGVDAKGAGPAAPALKARVPNLTNLSRDNRGQFPTAYVREMIMGAHVVAAHGSREMPIWGPVFHQVEGDADWGNVRLENLVRYLESIQSIRNPNAPSGASPHPQPRY